MASIAGGQRAGVIGGQGASQPLNIRARDWLLSLWNHFLIAFEQEVEARRLFLWLPVGAGAGVVLYLTGDREPALMVTAGLFTVCCALAYVARENRRAFGLCMVFAAITGGYFSGAFRNARVAAPVLQRIMIAKVSGFVEELDFRPAGARFIVRVQSIDGLEREATPYRIRLTTKLPPKMAAGDFISLTARMVPPARASLPGGYDFARDAWFVRLGGVGNALGKIETTAAPVSADFSLRFFAAIDRARNVLARRVETVIGGPAGAVGAAMVTGKRDFLDDPTKDIIREAGIFHIITIAGVQMTLVAGIFFYGFRRLLALSQTLALNYPIKKWAAGLAILGSIAYDIGTGSRVGTERALIMTLVVLGAVIFNRTAFSMRNLALAALAIIIFEPEAIMGASFQLSFAAVAGLMAVYEVKAAKYYRRAPSPEMPGPAPPQIDRKDRLVVLLNWFREGPGHMFYSTLCATAATASFMAYHFHELSPYVLIGNPLTLMMIEVVAVPGALLGSALYLVGLDGFVWQYVGLGIRFVLWIAQWIASVPGATVHLHAFAPWSLACLALAVLSVVIWQRRVLKLTALPFAALGLWGAFGIGAPFDLVVPPTADAVAMRAASGNLAVMGKSPSPFAVEQWLRADADGRPAKMAVSASQRALSRNAQLGEKGFPDASDPEAARCDKLGCVGTFADGRVVALVYELAAFAEDCQRADIVITPLYAPVGCAAPLVIDRARLQETGALTLRAGDIEDIFNHARLPDENRPWSPLPKAVWRPVDLEPISTSIFEDDDPGAPLR